MIYCCFCGWFECYCYDKTPTIRLSCCNWFPYTNSYFEAYKVFAWFLDKNSIYLFCSSSLFIFLYGCFVVSFLLLFLCFSSIPLVFSLSFSPPHRLLSFSFCHFFCSFLFNDLLYPRPPHPPLFLFVYSSSSSCFCSLLLSQFLFQRPFCFYLVPFWLLAVNYDVITAHYVNFIWSFSDLGVADGSGTNYNDRQQIRPGISNCLEWTWGTTLQVRLNWTWKEKT